MKKTARGFVLSVILCAASAHAQIERVSLSSASEQANDLSRYPSVSADGRFVAFKSSASNLVNGDSNGYDDMFVHDRQTGVTERVNLSSTGAQSELGGFSASRRPVISDDGQFVAFDSSARNLVENDGMFNDVFIRDRQSAATEIVNISTGGQRANRGTTSGTISVSADGRFVVYSSIANNLVGFTNGYAHVFIRDRELGRTEFVSLSSNGEQGNNDSSVPSISANGRYVTFTSQANNLVEGDTNGTQNGDEDIFVRDRQTGTTERVSLSSVGEQVDGQSYYPDISDDGQIVVFQSNANNLVANKTNGITDIYVHYRNTGMTKIVSVSPSGELANGLSGIPSISADGRFLAFASWASNLVDGDTNGPGFLGNDIFVHDLETGNTVRVNTSTSGEQANNTSYDPSISADGRYVAFTSQASNLVEGDTNSHADIFITANPLKSTDSNMLVVEKKINNEARETQDSAARLSTGTLYRQSYKVTNNSPNRIYQTRVFENGNMVCNFFALNPGQTRQRCDTFKTVQAGEQHVQVNVSAKVSGSGETLTNSTDAYYTGLNGNGELRVTHRINNVDADSQGQAQTLGSSQASVSYEVENIGEIELYQVKTYHDPVSPVNSGWALQCVLGPLKPGQVRYCKRDINLTEAGLNQAMGRVQGRNAIRSATDVVNASDPTYFIVP